MKNRVQALGVRLPDEDSERVRRNHDDRIAALEAMPAADLLVIANVELADGVATPINHGLGRVPRTVKLSVPRGATAAGYVNEIRDGSVDRRKQVLLQADSYGATITVDIEVL